jgi:hypothetical protein
MPSPRADEDKSAFISRCMGSEESRRKFPSQDQRYAFCQSQWSNRSKMERLMQRFKQICKRSR